MTIVYSIIALLLISQAICLLILVSKYSTSPEKRWKDKVLDSVHHFQMALKKEEAESRNLQTKMDQEVNETRSKYLTCKLQAISVEELAEFPGIGPSTVEKLQYSGFSTLFDIHTRHINIHGIGDKRLSDIQLGYQQLLRNTEASLQNSSNAASQEMMRTIKSIQTKYRNEVRMCEARLKAVRKVCEITSEAEQAAQRISFWGFINGSNRSHLPDRLKNFGFPNLAATLEKAEAKVREQTDAENRVPDPPAPKSSPGNPSQKAVEKPVPPIIIPMPVKAAPSEKRPAAPIPHKLDTRSNNPPKPAPSIPELSPFEELLQSPSTPPRPPLQPIPFQEIDIAQELLELTVELGYLIARADGRLAQAEQQMIEDYLESRYHSDTAMHTKAMSLCAHYTKAAIAIPPLVERMRKHCQSEAIVHLMNFAKEVALAGNLNDKKHQCYFDIGKRLGLALTSLQTAAPKTVESPPSPKTIAIVTAPEFVLKPQPAMDPEQLHRRSLEIDLDQPLSADLIRRQFNKLAERFQASKIAHLGEDFEKLAEQRYSSAREAAEFLLNQLGEKLVIEEKQTEPAGIRENKELEELFGAL